MGASSVHSSSTRSPARDGIVTVAERLGMNAYHHSGSKLDGKRDSGDVSARMSGSGGVFCPTWDWGSAACEPVIRLPGSHVDRRLEVNGSVEAADEDDGERGMDEYEESAKTEGEDVHGDDGEKEHGCDTNKAAQATDSEVLFDVTA